MSGESFTAKDAEAAKKSLDTKYTKDTKEDQDKCEPPRRQRTRAEIRERTRSASRLPPFDLT